MGVDGWGASGKKGVMRRETSQDNNNNDNTRKNPEKQDRIWKLNKHLGVARG